MRTAQSSFQQKTQQRFALRAHSHVLLARGVVVGLRAEGAADIKVVIGGIIPPRDVAELAAVGVAHIFPMGTPLPEIVAAFRRGLE